MNCTNQSCIAQNFCALGTIEINLKTKLVNISDKFYSISGYKKNDLISKDLQFWDLIFEEDKANLKDAIERVKSKSRKTRTNFRIKCNDGNLKWISLLLSVSVFENGIPTEIIGIQNDISEQMEELEFLNDINIKFSKLIENFSGGILMEDESRKIFYVNKDFLNLFSIPTTPSNLIGSDCKKSTELVKNLFTDPDDFITSTENCFINNQPIYGQIFKMRSGVILERDFIPIIEKNESKGYLWLYRDITKLKQHEEELKFRIGFEQVIINLSAKFINLDWNNIDKEIEESLGIIGKLISADRSYIFLFSDDLSIMNNTHEWTAEGVSQEKDNLQNIPTAVFPWWMNKLTNNEIIHIPSVNELPEEANAEKEILEPQGIKSLVVIPLVYLNVVIGYMGFDSVNEYKVWSSDSIKILSITGNVITNAIKRKESEEALSKSEERYKLISHLVSDFALTYQIDKSNNIIIEWATESTNRFLGISSGNVYSIEMFNKNIHVDDLNYVIQKREKLRYSSHIQSEYRIILPNGDSRWIKEFGLSESMGRNNSGRYHIAAQDITESKLYEERLQIERTLFRTIIDNIPDPIYVKDLDGKKVLVNAAEMEVLGVKNINDIVGKTDFDFYPPESAEATKIEDELVMKSGNSILSKEGYVVTRNGEKLWFIGNKIPLYDNYGKISGLVGISYNITNRKKSEEALKISEAKYKDVVNSVREVIFQTNIKGEWVFLNNAWKEITGYEIDESIGKNSNQFVIEKDRVTNTSLINSIVTGENDQIRYEIRFLTKYNEIKWVEVYARGIIRNKYDIVGISGTINDITLRKQSDEEIRKLTRAVETSPTGIILATLDGKITYVNPGFVNIGNYDNMSEFIGKKFFDFTTNESTKALTREILPSLNVGEVWNGETLIKTASGDFIPIEMICTMIPDENNDPQYILANFYDITHRKKAELEIKNALKKEKEVNELKSKFISMVSHEFRTPLAAILSSSDLLDLYWDKWTTEKRSSLLLKIKKSIKDLIEMLNDVTEINRAESGKVKINNERINVVSFLNELLEELYSGYPQHPKVQLKISENNIFAITDKKLLRQIFVNLISNAIKYTDINKNIYISLIINNATLVFSVKDEGIGIPEEDAKYLFEPFMRSKNAVKIKGTGLGLSITKRAVELLNATIEFESRENYGSTFVVKIPTNNYI
jgi:PAS domain S-box-containing protein